MQAKPAIGIKVSQMMLDANAATFYLIFLGQKKRQAKS